MGNDSASDSGTLFFRDLEERKKSLDARFSALSLRSANEIKYPTVAVLPRRKNLSDEAVEQLCKLSKDQHGTQSKLLQEHEECSSAIKGLDMNIKELENTLEELEKELTETVKESKAAAKPLTKAIKKYALNLDMQINVEDLDDTHFIAFVKFTANKDNNKDVEFTVDKKRRCIVGFKADSVMSEEEANKLEATAKGTVGLNGNVLLRAIRPLCI